MRVRQVAHGCSSIEWLLKDSQLFELREHLCAGSRSTSAHFLLLKEVCLYRQTQTLELRSEVWREAELKAALGEK